MIVMGIDPSTITTGYGIVTYEGNKILPVDFGVIRTNTAQALPSRLLTIFESMSLLIDRFHPDEIAVEEIFQARNAQMALKLGQARGVVILASALKDISTAEYSPREVKLAVVGYGNASKEQVRRMIRDLLSIHKERMEYDAADALAVAVCHCHRIGMRQRMSQ
ncbi:crossover junction endodeoxyribonuclease RuvC [bacterium]|nr:crossover junction endodeoxyribonuclease RuvC [bacterium]